MGLTYLDLQIMGSLYVFDILPSLPMAPLKVLHQEDAETIVMQAVLEDH